MWVRVGTIFKVKIHILQYFASFVRGYIPQSIPQPNSV